MVLDGSFSLFNEFFETHGHEQPPEGWSFRNSHNYTDSQIDWFLQRGCKWIKVEAGPGDVILWDSRTIHYGAEAKGHTPRVATCEFSSPYRITRNWLTSRRVLQTRSGCRSRSDSASPGGS